MSKLWLRLLVSLSPSSSGSRSWRVRPTIRPPSNRDRPSRRKPNNRPRRSWRFNKNNPNRKLSRSRPLSSRPSRPRSKRRRSRLSPRSLSLNSSKLNRPRNRPSPAGKSRRCSPNARSRACRASSTPTTSAGRARSKASTASSASRPSPSASSPPRSATTRSCSRWPQAIASSPWARSPRTPRSRTSPRSCSRNRRSPAILRRSSSRNRTSWSPAPGFPPRASMALQRAGVLVLQTALGLDLDTQIDNLLLIGYILGEEQRALAFADEVTARYQALQAATAGKQTRPLVISLTQYGDSLWTAGRGSTQGSLIVAAGGVNAAAEIEGNQTIGLESVIAMAPEVIFIPQPAAYGADEFRRSLFDNGSPGRGARDQERRRLHRREQALHHALSLEHSRRGRPRADTVARGLPRSVRRGLQFGGVSNDDDQRQPHARRRRPGALLLGRCPAPARQRRPARRKRTVRRSDRPQRRRQDHPAALNLECAGLPGRHGPPPR